jgi:4-diphosphocytidyl-2-C-methyl-D-erythritol kinase
MPLLKSSGCKVNLLLNILRKREDGFHELETVMHPIAIFDSLAFSTSREGLELTCSEPSLPTDSRNLVYRAAESFLKEAGILEGVRIHLEKKIPMAAGLGGGSGNAATTLLGLSELFGNPLGPEALSSIAASLGSDIPFFLQGKPAIGVGRGEKIESLDFFPALKHAAFLLIYPGFGISTAWAYQSLGQFPAALNGKPGRAQTLLAALNHSTPQELKGWLYNSLEAPALHKYPILVHFQEFLLAHGALAALMSGSGSATFAIFEDLAASKDVAKKFKDKFGASCWVEAVPATPG